MPRIDMPRAAVCAAALIPLLMLGCSEPASPAEEAAPTSARDGIGPVPEAWVATRAAEAQARMASSPAGQRVARAIEAHGGLTTWLSAGTVEFDFDYQPLASPEDRRNTHNEIDLWGGLARQVEHGDAGAEGLATFGFDGEEAWITPNADAFPSTARFWATTPYYFVGIPFVLADPGVRYENLPDAQIEGTSYELVKASFESGTGDSPDDYYILYLHPETHRVDAIRYVVAYPGYFPEGGHTPEKLMRYEDYREVDGLLMPHSLRTFSFSQEKDEPDELVTNITAGGFAFGTRWDAEHFARPEGSELSAAAPPPAPRAEPEPEPEPERPAGTETLVDTPPASR